MITAKGTSLCESTSFEPFFMKTSWGIASRAEGKVRESHKAPIGMCVTINMGLELPFSLCFNR